MRYAIALFALLSVTACSHSSSDGGSSTPPPPAPPITEKPGTFSSDQTDFQTPVLLSEDLVVAAGGNIAYFLNGKGQLLRQFDAGEKIAAAPTVYLNSIYLTTISGKVITLDFNGVEIRRIDVKDRPFGPVEIMTDETVVFPTYDSIYFMSKTGVQKAKIKTEQFGNKLIANRGTTILVTQYGTGIVEYDSSAAVIQTIDLPTTSFSNPTYIADANAFLYGTKDNQAVVVLSKSVKVKNVAGLVSEYAPCVLADHRAAFTIWNGSVIFTDGEVNYKGTFKPDDDRIISTGAEVETGIVALLGDKGIYYVNADTATLIEKIDFPSSSAYVAFGYVPLVLKGGVLVVSVSDTDTNNSSKVYFVKRGQKLN